ncbi:hypothetical protein MMYC01_206845 [Madurella mycetomatis]|uniref:C2H2-type domain-containing protein n=1 Tax=Madurella mycetomatis TaxID=100816 RepID=A0A175VZ46_9PEZI|nr:hypothetical protein MMYC01_206845 [Madurella mycetomatis]
MADPDTPLISHYTETAKSTRIVSSSDSGYESYRASNHSSSSSSGYYTDARETRTRTGAEVVIITHRNITSGYDCAEPRASDYVSRRSFREARQGRRSVSGVASTRESPRSAVKRSTPNDASHHHADISNAPSVTIDSGAEDDSSSSNSDEDGSASEDEATQGSLSINERSSESGSDSSLVSPLLDTHRRQIVDQLMIEFRDLLNQTIGARSRPSGSDPPSASPSGHQGYQQNSSAGLQQSRGRDGGRSSSGSSQGRGDGNMDEGSGAGHPLEMPLGRKFACPYFKRDPRKYRKHRSCVGPGWTAVHRVKEHIYRRHKLPVFCTRCGVTFTRDTDLVAHSRLAQACEVRVFETPDGFSKEQERILRRKRKLAGSEESKWREMYKVLFPDDDEADVPSPYNESGDGMTWEAQRTQEFDNYERYLRRELPRVVRQRLEIAASEFSGPLENQLRGQLIDVVRDSQSQLFRLYRSTYPATANPGTASSQLPLEFRGEPAVADPTVHDMNGGGAADPVDFDFSAFFPQPLIDEHYVNPTDVNFTAPIATTPGGDHQAFSDSGYGSMGFGVSDCIDPGTGDPSGDRIL